MFCFRSFDVALLVVVVVEWSATKKGLSLQVQVRVQHQVSAQRSLHASQVHLVAFELALVVLEVVRQVVAVVLLRRRNHLLERHRALSVHDEALVLLILQVRRSEVGSGCKSETAVR